MMKLEDLPENKKVNITIRKTQFFIGFFTAIIVFIGSFVVYPIVYVQDKNYTLDNVASRSADHEKRIKNLEDMVPQINQVNREMNKVLDELMLFRNDLSNSKEEWIRLFREFDIKKKN